MPKIARWSSGFLVFLAAPSMAATLTWTGATGTNWSAPGNWTPAQSPASGDQLTLNTSSPNLPTTNDLAGVDLFAVALAAGSTNLTVGGNAISIQSGGQIANNASGRTLMINVPITLNGPATFSSSNFGVLEIVQPIGGTGGLTVSGAAILLDAPNTYAGSTTVLGSGVVSLNRALAANGQFPPTSAITVNGPSGTVILGKGTHTFASLAGAGAVSPADIPETMTLIVGGDNTTTTFSGVLSGPALPIFNVVKEGAGTLTLALRQDTGWRGSLTVNAGRLDVNSAIFVDGTTVSSGATLGGTGKLGRGHVVINGGVLAPGVGVGTFTIGDPATPSTLTFDAASTLAVELNGTTAGTQHDQVAVNGNANLAGTLDVSVGFSPVAGQQFTIMTATGAISGAFSSIVGPAGYTFTPAYGANAVVLTASAVPSPPGAPTIGTVTPGNAAATVAFTPPASNGGFTINRYTATCGTQSASGAASPITVGNLANGVTVSCSVTATNAIGTGPASGTVSVTPSFNVFSGPSATGSGTITASFTGGGPGCSFVSPQFIGAPPGSPPVPATVPVPGVVFPHGMFDFTLSGCTPGSTVAFTIAYPSPVAGALYWKYGPTPDDPSAHWYRLPATITGNIVTFSIVDGGLGDDDRTANGTFVDQGGPGVGGAIAVVQIPTLSEWALAVLGVLIAGIAFSLRPCGSRSSAAPRPPRLPR